MRREIVYDGKNGGGSRVWRVLTTMMTMRDWWKLYFLGLVLVALMVALKTCPFWVLVFYAVGGGGILLLLSRTDEHDVRPVLLSILLIAVLVEFIIAAFHLSRHYGWGTDWFFWPLNMY